MSSSSIQGGLEDEKELVMIRKSLMCITAALTVLVIGSLNAVSSGKQAGPKVLLIYDMEGITEVVNSRDVSFGSQGYANARRSLTEDVNAAIRGLLRAGASEVVLTDGHGSGNPDPDYDTDLMHERARFELRDEPYDAYVDVLDSTFDAVVAIAMHSGAGGDGFLSHTYYGHTRWVMNGLALNESMIVAASAARFDIPLILVTGDDVLQREVEAFSPGTRYVTVKHSTGRTRTTPRPREEVTREIEAAAEDALRNLEDIAPWMGFRSRDRFVNQFSYTLPEHTVLAIEFPGTRAVNDRTVELMCTSFIDSYLSFRALANYTAMAPVQTLFTGLQQLDDYREILGRVRAALPDRATPSFTPTGDTVDMSRSARGRHGYK